MKIKKYKYPTLKKKIWQSIAWILLSVLVCIALCFVNAYFFPFPYEDNTIQVEGKCVDVVTEHVPFAGGLRSGGEDVWIIVLDDGNRYSIYADKLEMNADEFITLCKNQTITIRHMGKTTWMVDAIFIEELCVSSQMIYSLADVRKTLRGANIVKLIGLLLAESIAVFLLILPVITSDDYYKWSDRRKQRKKLLAREKEKARKAELKAQAKNNKTG